MELRLTRRITLVAGLYALAGGIVSLAGWTLDIRRFTDWDNDGISIQPNATLCVIFSGLAVVSLAAGRARLTAVCGAIVLFIGGLTFLQWISGLSFGVDTLLMFGREWGRTGVVFPGRMGPPGSLSWTLIGAALISSGGPPRLRRPATALALTTAAISALSLVGYLYGVDQLYTLPYFTVISFQTTSFIMAVSVGIIVSHPEREPMRMLLDRGGAGMLARGALPLVLFVPVVVGYLRVRGQDAGLYDTGLGSALTSLILIGFLAGIMWRVLRAVRMREQALEAARLAAEADARALEEREHRLRGILDSITDGFCTFDKDWRFTFVNDLLVRRFGMPREQIIGQNVWDLFPQAVGSVSYVQLHRAMNERVPVGYEIFFEPFGMWIFDKAAPTADGGLAVYSADITSRKQAEEQVLRGAELLTFLIDRSPSGFYIVDADFRISHINADSQARAFRNVNPAIGRRLDDAMRVLWPEPLATEIIAIFRRTLETGEPYKSPGLVSPRADLDSTETYEWQLQRITMPDGRFAIVCYYYDSTALRQAEHDLREAEERAAFVRRASGVGFWYCDLPFDVLQWDDLVKAHFHLPPDARVTIDTFYDRIHPDDREPTRKAIERSISERSSYDTCYRTVHPVTGAEKWVQAIGRTFYAPDGTPARFDGVTLDVTEKRAAELALRDADRRKDEFLATLAHELRNPLAPVRNAVQVLHLKGPADPELQWARDVIDRQMRQMTRLIDDLMDVSRISQGKLVLKRERIALAGVVREAVETSRPFIEKCGHELTVSLPPQPLRLDADATRLAQVFANLLNNAAKYTERGGRIRLDVERQGSDAVVSVNDTGIGIPAEKLGSVFELFSQVQGALERSQGGLGIGLSLVKRLVEMHQGSVEARSEGPGKGSEFVVRLPILIETPRAAGRQESEEPDLHVSSLRILIVDDNRDAGDSLGLMLRLMGNEIQTAYDGEEAVRAADEFRPQVMLLDIGLPKLNGYEVCRRLRQTPRGEHMVLIAVTGWGQDEDKRKAKEAGFDHHLVKPVDPRGLIKLLGSLPAVHAG